MHPAGKRVLTLPRLSGGRGDARVKGGTLRTYQRVYNIFITYLLIAGYQNISCPEMIDVLLVDFGEIGASSRGEFGYVIAALVFFHPTLTVTVCVCRFHR